MGRELDEKLILIMDRNRIIVKEIIKGTHIIGAIWGIQKYLLRLFNYDKIKL